MANAVTSKKVAGDQITIYVTHDTANPSTDFELLPALDVGFYRIMGFSCTPSNTGVADFFSGAGATASNEIWSCALTDSTRIDFAGAFINTGATEALNLRSTAIIGTFTLVAQMCP
jgi:hypothetical protein